MSGLRHYWNRRTVTLRKDRKVVGGSGPKRRQTVGRCLACTQTLNIEQGTFSIAASVSGYRYIECFSERTSGVVGISENTGVRLSHRNGEGLAGRIVEEPCRCRAYVV